MELNYPQKSRDSRNYAGTMWINTGFFKNVNFIHNEGFRRVMIQFERFIFYGWLLLTYLDSSKASSIFLRGSLPFWGAT